MGFPLLNLIRAINLYPAVGIMFWGFCCMQILEVKVGQLWVLWLAAGLLIYNLDRHRADAADDVNQPERQAIQARYHWVGLAVLVVAASVIVAYPFITRQMALARWLWLGIAVCALYVIPIGGKRIKDMAVLKSFFPPLAITVALIGLPLVGLTTQQMPTFPMVLFVSIWSLGLLGANVVRCDLRDLEGDKAHGVVTIAVHLGETETLKFLRSLEFLGTGMGMFTAFAGDKLLYGFLMLVPVGWLAVTDKLPARIRQQESFCEWWVDGMLYIAAVAILLVPRLIA